MNGPMKWDDWSTLHEFGHHVMAKCAPPFPPCTTSIHFWHKKYPVDKNIGYVEGWANLFAVVVTGSIYQINTKKGIGATNDTTYYHNIENPWIGSLFDTLAFEGGPRCEGSVAGALWDIYDSQNEIPYHSYPSPPQFPDTALADSLTMGFDEIWNVFDNYDPAGTPTNCWTIFHFRSGWNYYDYGHKFALNQILLHHRIRDSIPAKPTGLSANQEGNKVRLYWHKNSEPDLNGYRIYRRSKQEFTNPPQPWSSWALLADKSSPTDTTHLDQTVKNRFRYRYRITAYDSLGNESEYSDSVEILVQFGINPDAIGTLSFHMSSIINKMDDLKIRFSVVDDRYPITIKLYDVSGRLVRKEKLGNICIGKDEYFFETSGLSAGVYFVRIETEEYDKIKKVVIVR